METDIHKIAGQLAGKPVDQLIPCRNGRNSRVFKALSGNQAFALKSYPDTDSRDRLGSETRALRYYEASGNPFTPRLLATDTEHRFALMEWIEGSPVLSPSAHDVEQALDFISRTHAARPADDGPFGLASEPCLCGADLDRHIAVRLERLQAVSGQEPELHQFLEQKLITVLKQARALARDTAFFSISLPRSKQTLVPADFGFHNALKSDDGKIYFFDFEYFGRDDPVRLTADFLFHPGIELGEELQAQFRQGMIETFREDEEFPLRLLTLSPMYALRWALILLNEFLPERWGGRVFAGESASWKEIKSRQLHKARLTLDKARTYLPPS